MIALATLLVALASLLAGSGEASGPAPCAADRPFGRAHAAQAEQDRRGAPKLSPLTATVRAASCHSGNQAPVLAPALHPARGADGGAAGHTATEADVAEAARAAVAAVWPDAEVAVVRLSGRAADAAPPLRVVFDDPAPKGGVSARVEHQTAAGWESAGWAYLDVAVFETVPVLTRDVARDEPLADAVALQRVETTTVRDGLDARPGADWLATRSLRAGTVLTARHVRAPAAVEPGDPVRVRYTRGAVVITLDCQARERGAVGETITTTCPSARATRVRLTAPGAADWTATL
ncbi:flagellar basal body P-ring formation chaperone FlgA [Rubrivirga sp. IMCC43871]|uniref:flagellar basal body P-ring formation chaperone FlgA n=1 Tax=Rubrivirga sp. IMCC43871 TaxID=3391575 RepID=UPI00399015D8